MDSTSNTSFSAARWSWLYAVTLLLREIVRTWCIISNKSNTGTSLLVTMKKYIRFRNNHYMKHASQTWKYIRHGCHDLNEPHSWGNYHSWHRFRICWSQSSHLLPSVLFSNVWNFCWKVKTQEKRLLVFIRAR